jgi:hypothetical protein
MPAESDVVTHRAAMQIAPIEGGVTFAQNQTIRFQIRSGDFIDPGSVQAGDGERCRERQPCAPCQWVDLFVREAHHLFQHWRRDRRHRTSYALSLSSLSFLSY